MSIDAQQSTAPTTDDSPVVEAPPARLLVEPAEGVPPVIADQADVAACADSLRNGSGPIAVDAERAGGYRYGNRAYLIQLRRTNSSTHLIDPIQLTDFSPIANAISDVEWILHAASQDLECLAEVGLVPTQIFDTEVAARILGRPRVGLAALAESELGVSLAKAHSAADWSTRPLPEDWLRYAALDVELLAELRELLGNELESLGRLEWAQEEFDFIREMPAKPTRPDPWRRTSGIHRVRTARGLAIVAQLWQARDSLAQERDIAPGRVLPDAAICAAAIAAPKSRNDLAALPEFSGRGTKRRIAYWWQAVEQGLNTGPGELPQPVPASSGPPPPRSWPERSPEAAARLAAAREGLAQLNEQLGIPVENILTPDLVRRLCWEPPASATPAAISEFLTELGARQWQIKLTQPVLVSALKAGS